MFVYKKTTTTTSKAVADEAKLRVALVNWQITFNKTKHVFKARVYTYK